MRLVDNYTYVPLRFVSEAFGASVNYKDDNKDGIITIVTENNVSKDGIKYENGKYGFSLVFPTEWKDKYYIEENDKSITAFNKD